MNEGKTVLAQLMDFLPHYEFQKCVRRYHAKYPPRHFSFWDQFLCMAFAQLTYRESLRDIETCLRTMQTRLYHLGIRGPISRSTLAEANDQRSWKIYADFAQILIARARRLYAKDSFSVDLQDTVYALDSSTIDLCLSVFPWARFRKTKAAIKLHTLLDLRGSIPSFVHITDGKVHDVRILDLLIPEPGSFYVMDRGYLDFARLYRLHQGSSFFVIRAKSNLRFRRLSSNPVDKTTGLLSDITIRLTGLETAKDYPESLRRIGYRDPLTHKRLFFLTNKIAIEAFTVCELYRSRWQVELFFKWIKQHLRIKKFYGTSENAVKTQIWIAVSVYVLVAIIKKELKLPITLHTVLQILSVTAFEKEPLFQLLNQNAMQDHDPGSPNQLILFN